MSNFEKRYANLNEQQKEAVDAIEGPVMVIAGPGSGKTELLGLRIANILRQGTADAEDILCLTFTDAAAKNMRERLAGLIGKDAYKVAIHTFHSFGSEIINRHPECFYEGAIYAPIDEITKTEIIEDIIKNLKWSSRLRSYHPEQGYTYLRDIISRIDDIKKGGLSPEEFESLIAENKDFEDEANKFIGKVFISRISLGMLADLEQLQADIAAISVSRREHPLDDYPPLKNTILESLGQAIAEVEETEEKKSKTKPITAWKKNYLKKNAAGKWLLASSFHNKELSDLAKVYKEYQDRIHKEGFYDFADMILDTVQELEKNAELRYELQEKYLYALVDEFQDTNGAQMRLLDAVLNTEVNEGSPNVLVVGDDDQSIYKFQGASLRNFSEFLEKYREVKKVVLTHNYRSTQEILDYSKSVIERAEDRLTKKDGSIIKDLIAARMKSSGGCISQKEFLTKIEEYIFIAEEIKRLRAENPEEEIAVISRKHSNLEQLAVLANYYDIPVSYERNKNILEEKHIREIITLARFVDSLNSKRTEEADEYLPDILAFPFLELDRLDIWKISSQAHKSRSNNWLEMMLDFGGKPKLIAEFLIALGTEAKRRTMEEVLDLITGSAKIDGVAYVSGFKEYYFSKGKFDDDRLEYLEYLFDLQSLFGKLREYRTRETLYLKDLIDFLDLHETHKLSIYKTHRLSKGKNAVALLTAHKAKGLEFDTVFIINCNEKSWMKDRNGGKLSLPENIPLSAEKDDIDDKVRLFFVAVTRAKSRLYLTNYCSDEGEKRNSDRLRFLDPDLATSEIEAMETETIRTAEEIISFREEIRHYEIKNVDEEELLKSVLEDYKLSVTHLNNFLNVTKGGPANFLESNLLHFPGAKSPASSYGTAIHESFREFYKRFKEREKLPESSELQDIFEEKLHFQGLNKKDFAEKLEKGKDELGSYYDENVDVFDVLDLVETDFKSEGVVVGECPITGKIDRVAWEDEKSKICKVYDYKTGKPFASWQPSDEYLKVKAYEYKNQLIFYKILIENSRSFHRAEVVSGGIDFISSLEGGMVRLDLEIRSEDVARLRKLIEIIYGKIMDLDFPDIEKYPDSFKGVQEFEEDLLSGRI
ncbi:MAG: ATP-dependent DNA helicase [Candidatus Pacebacteria bacterium]|nr:ATP-dependent DNA helicase [Candidatus Paceibacterota bacterium]